MNEPINREKQISLAIRQLDLLNSIPQAPYLVQTNSPPTPETNMSLNKCIFDFHLLAEGWLSVPPRDQDTAASSAPPGSVAWVRMTEFGSDEKPEIWYKAEILARASHREAKALIEKYGLPKAILVNCPAQKEELRAQFLSN